MRLFRLLSGRPARLAAAAAVTLTAGVSVLHAQFQPRPRYHFEVGAAGAVTHFATATDLKTGFGGIGRLGFWLPLNLSIEGEFGLEKPSTVDPYNLSWSVRRISGALLLNVPLGPSNYLYFKGGYGSINYSGKTDFGDDACGTIAVLGAGPCGNTGALLGGLGLRLGLTRNLMLRAEGLVTTSSIESGGESTRLTNVGGNLGLSVMLGTTVPGDRDRDGVLDNADRCAATPAGVRVDARGCPRDGDKDGVPDGLDRCDNTPAGATVDRNGCPRDADADGVPDAMDKCSDTAPGATVDKTGCPHDADGDGVLDGLDRCSDTPAGATVDALGCPGDEDSDGVLDGLDRCPRTPPGSAVNAFGCLPGQDADQDGVTDALDQCPDTPAGSTVQPNGCAEDQTPKARAAAPTRGKTVVLPGVRFASGSARLDPASYPVLDSVAAALQASPDMVIEIGGHTDATGNATQNQYLSRLRAEAVRAYLVSKGISGQRMTARGYGSDRPLVRGNTAAARARNRRVEITVLGTSP